MAKGVPEGGSGARLTGQASGKVRRCSGAGWDEPEFSPVWSATSLLQSEAQQAGLVWSLVGRGTPQALSSSAVDRLPEVSQSSLQAEKPLTKAAQLFFWLLHSSAFCMTAYDSEASPQGTC